MKYGISAGVLLVDDGRLLLVHHREAGRFDFWVPPGGRLEGSESIFECARRETLEETGLLVELDRILYIQEFWEPGYHFCKFFILGRLKSGDLTLANKELGESWLVEARFFSKDDLQAGPGSVGAGPGSVGAGPGSVGDVTVYPEILKDQFWDDQKSDFTGTRYLGLERMRSETLVRE